MIPIDLLDASFCVPLTLALAHFLWQGLLIAIAAAAAAAALGRRSARLRYAVYLVALAVMPICLPVTFAVVRGGIEPDARVAPAVTVPVAEKGDRTGLPIRHEEREAALASSSMAKDAATATPEPTPRAAAWPRLRWQAVAPYTTLAYAVGVLAMIVRLLSAVWCGRRFRRSAQWVDAGLRAWVRRQAHQLGMRWVPAVAYCRLVAVPVVVGVVRPMILMPLCMTSGFAPDEIETILLHELAHIRRYDHLVNLAQHVVEALLFFHPAVWYLSARIRAEREYCCDDAVLAAGGKRIAYAASLVRVAELVVRGRTSARSVQPITTAASGPSRSPLARRILRVLQEPAAPQVRLTAGSTTLLAAVLLAGLALPVAMLRSPARAAAPAASPAKPDKSPSGPSAPRSLAAQIPEAGTIEFLGMIHSSKPEAGWWAPDGSKVEVPQVDRSEIETPGTVAAFRVRPADLQLEGYFLKMSTMLDFRSLRRGKSPGIVLAAIDLPEGRRYGNLLVAVHGVGRRLHTFGLTTAELGKIRRVDQYGVQAFAGLERLGPGKFRVNVLYDANVPPPQSRGG